MSGHKYWYKRGLKDGLPIGLGYLAVSLALGISASRAGMTAVQATITSLLINASAGEYAGFTAIAAGATYLEVTIVEAVANARYLLMSCALSQKLPESATLGQRMLVGFYTTDEIFGASVSVPDKLDIFYTCGLATMAAPGWALGTFLGVVMGDVLPMRVISALSVGLYGMFIAIFIPPAKKSRIILGLVIISFAASYFFNTLAMFAAISSSFKVILLTVVISLAAAILFPIKDEETEGEGNA
ncbi:MAG: AzlC family ABC transporter permease [Oscillospiraceae bacterium]|nr:AzlC family ABC transporter permease [Oscillospiraceae bacterium]